MAIHYNPTTVSDGLVLALDAANTRSYVGSGTTWTDVSYNGNNGTLTNGPAYTTVGFNEPFGGAGGVYFDGTGDYLSVADDASLQLGSGDFTIEFWIYLNSLSGNPTPIDKAYTGGAASPVGYLLQYSSSALNFYSGIILTSSTTDTTSVWIHYALVRNSGTTTLYRNGVSVASGSDNTNYTYNGSLGIGANILGGSGFGAGAGAINGYMSNLRIVKGTALYTSNFTPPRSLLTAVANTSLLTCQKGSITDASSNNFAITVNGDARPVYGFPSFKFDGTNDYVTIGSSPYTGFGTDDFTIESWVYLTSNTVQNNVIYDCRYSASATGPTLYYIPTTGLLMFYNGSNRIIGGAISINTWTYVAMIRKSGYTRLYINATQVGSTYTDSNNYTSGVNNGVIGAFYDGTGVWNGNISNTRVYKGKGLTAEEVEQNYNALKGRFGL